MADLATRPETEARPTMLAGQARMPTTDSLHATLPQPTSEEPTARPSLRAVLRRVGTNLVVACVIPACLFYASFRLYGVWVAMLLALSWSYGAITWRAVTGRRPSGLLVLTACVLTARTALSFATNSSYLYFLQPIISDTAIGVAFLVSLTTARPLVARLAGDFYPMDDELSLRPALRRLFWRLTLMWGALGLGKAVTMLWLLHHQSLDAYVLTKSISAPTLNALAVGATIAAAVAVGRKEGLLSPRGQAQLPS